MTALDMIGERTRHLETVEVDFSGNGPPNFIATSGVHYWDFTNHNEYVNNSAVGAPANSWQLIGGGGGPVPHALLHTPIHTDTLTHTPPVRGDMITANATPLWNAVAHPGAASRFWRANALDPNWAQILIADLPPINEGPGIDIVGGWQVGLGGDTILQYHSNGNPVSEHAATVAGFNAAIAALAANDTLVLPACLNIAGDFTIATNNVIIKGDGAYGTGRPRITGTITITGNIVALANLSIADTAAGLTRSAIDVGAGGSAYIFRCDLTATGGATWNVAVVNSAGSYVTLTECDVYGTERAISANSSITFARTCQLVNNSAALATVATFSSGQAMLSHSNIINENGGGPHLDLVASGGTLAVYGCFSHVTRTNIAPMPLRTVGAISWGAGDRSCYYVEDWHAYDIEAAALTRHLPLPAAAGRVARDDGVNWLSAFLDFDDLAGDCDLADLADWARGSIIRGGAVDWEAYDAKTNHFILVGDGIDIVSKAFDWDDMAAGAGADMVHNHSNASEGDEIPLASLGSYARGSIIRGGAADWEAYDAKTDGAALVGDGVDIISDLTPTWKGLHTFNGGWLLGAGQTADLNGVADALVFDADGDTTISAPTDNQIDIEIAGVDDFTFTMNTFNVLAGSSIEMAQFTSIGAGGGPVIMFDAVLSSLIITGCRVGIGLLPQAKLHVDQALAINPIPVLLLDQADVSEQCIKFRSNGVDRDINLFTVDVTGTPTEMWDESENARRWNKNFRMDAGLNFGIGINPTTALFHTATSNASNITYLDTYDDGAGFAQIKLRKSDTDTIGTLAQTDNNDMLGSVEFHGVNNVPGRSRGAQILATQIGAAGANVPTRLAFETRSATGANPVTVLNEAGLFGIGGVTSPLAQCHIDQPYTTGALPVMLLDQADIDVVLVKVIGTATAASANRTLVAASDFGTPGALIGWMQIEIQDDGNRIADSDYWVPFYASPT